jgi:hypothetical protein
VMKNLNFKIMKMSYGESRVLEDTSSNPKTQDRDSDPGQNRAAWRTTVLCPGIHAGESKWNKLCTGKDIHVTVSVENIYYYSTTTTRAWDSILFCGAKVMAFTDIFFPNKKW